MKRFYQCRLRKGNSIMVSFLPANFAKVGNTVGLKENDVWSEGWKVLSVGAAMTEEALREQEKRVRSGSHRKGSDI
jgi:hypothetical protein